MDFLDPKKRRAYHIRLMVGYFLVAIVIGLATVIIVYGANGYGINTKTGQIVENGLLFADSKPGGAEIYLNGQDKNTTTSARLILPAGKYTLALKKAGYRDWSRTFTLNGQSIARYVYPFLFPQTPRVTTLKTYAAAPGLMTETPDRHWLLVEADTGSGDLPVFDQYDTSTLDNASPTVSQLAFPAGLLTDFSASSKLTVVEWSTDNDHVLLKHDYPGGSEFIVFSRSHPDQSFNVNRVFNVAPYQVRLVNKKSSQLYLLNQPGGQLRIGDTSNGQIAPAVLNGVLAFEPYGSDRLTYVTASGEPGGQVQARIWDDGQTYQLYEFSAGTHYLIDAAQYKGDFYYVAGSDTASRINIYKNPLEDIQNPALGKAIPVLALQAKGADKVGFSDNARMIAAESGQTFAVYDLETKTSYHYDLTPSLAADMQWMDGNRFIGDSSGRVLVLDSDGTNQQLLTATADPDGGLFDRNYNHLLTLAPVSGSSAQALQDVDMRAGTDLPNK